MKCFISYRREQLSIVSELAKDIDRNHDVWYDQTQSGDRQWWREVLDEIKNCDVFLPVYDRNYDLSYTCSRELAYASALQKLIIPIIVGKLNLNNFKPRISHLYNWQEYGDDKDSYQQLVDRLRNALESTEQADKRYTLDADQAPAYPNEDLLDMWDTIQESEILPQARQDEFLRKLLRQKSKGVPATDITFLADEFLQRDDVLDNVGTQLRKENTPNSVTPKGKGKGKTSWLKFGLPALLTIGLLCTVMILNRPIQTDVDIEIRATLENVAVETKKIIREVPGVSTGSLVENKCAVREILPDTDWSIVTDTLAWHVEHQEGTHSTRWIDRNPKKARIELCAQSRMRTIIDKETGNNFVDVSFSQTITKTALEQKTKRVRLEKPARESTISFDQPLHEFTGVIVGGQRNLSFIGDMRVENWVVEKSDPKTIIVRWQPLSFD